jgi:membrane-bound lytic murein transglycosylase B
MGRRLIVMILAMFLAVAAPAPVAVAVAPGASAAADARSRQAKSDARIAAATVDALLDRYTRASAQEARGVARLSRAFGTAASADVSQDQAQAQQRLARAAQRQQVRAVYASGGSAGLFSSVLAAGSPDDALWRVSTADRILGIALGTTRREVSSHDHDAAAARHRAAVAEQAGAEQAAALTSLQHQSQLSLRALEAAQSTLAALSAQARHAQVAAAAARRIEAAQAAARWAERTSAGPLSALGIPAEYLAAYHGAALTCPGLPWTLLAAVGQVESGHGRNPGPSSAGAIGPMQFMPATFASYAVDGDRDGTKDAWDPQDAIFTAARYLCVLGARGGSGDGIQQALLGYNHAQWYVDLVLSVQNAIIASTG